MAMDTSRAGGRGRRPSFRGASFSRISRGVEVLQAWPSSRGKNLHPKTKAQMEYFRQVQWAFKYSSAWVQRSFAESVKGTPLMPRDLFLMAISGRMHRVIDENGKSWWSVAAIKNISDSLDVIAQLPGSMLFRRGDRWAGTSAGEPGFVLTYEDDDTPPSWQPPSGAAGTDWGDIGGDLSDQGDLEAALNALSATIGTKAADTIFTALARGLVPAPGPSSGRVLLDDATWAAIPPPRWGEIGGALADQGDLEAALNALSAAIGTKAADTIFTALANGLVPAPGAANGNYLRDDGTWQPAAGGSGGGLTMIGDIVLFSDFTEITLWPISGGFKDLIIDIQARSSAGIVNDELKMRFNNDRLNHYAYRRQNALGTADQTAIDYIGIGSIAGDAVAANIADQVHVEIPNYVRGQFFKNAFAAGSCTIGTSGNQFVWSMSNGRWNEVSPINEIRFTLATGNFKTGSRFTLYGRQ